MSFMLVRGRRGDVVIEGNRNVGAGLVRGRRGNVVINGARIVSAGLLRGRRKVIGALLRQHAGTPWVCFVIIDKVVIPRLVRGRRGRKRL